jgi:hypothetical protein
VDGVPARGDETPVSPLEDQPDTSPIDSDAARESTTIAISSTARSVMWGTLIAPI